MTLVKNRKLTLRFMAFVGLLVGTILLVKQNQWHRSELDESTSESTATCSPRSSIVFLKTHKTGSSTVQITLLRYGYFHNKIFVLPASGPNIGFPQYFRARFVPSPESFGGQYDILAHHARMNYTEMRSLMPEDSVFITILRNPVTQFESLFHYFNLNKFWDVEFDLFNNQNERIPNRVFLERQLDKYGPNQMMFDLGFEERYFYDHQKTVDYILELDAIFDLVMITERMDESLVLLKELLCWDYDDVVTFKVNSRSDADKSKITEAGSKRIQQLSSADYLLYRHFADKFDRQVKKFGEARMKQEVETLRDIRDHNYRLCVDGTYVGDKHNVVYYSAKRNIDRQCQFLTNSNLNLTDFIRKEQSIKYPGSVFSYSNVQ